MVLGPGIMSSGLTGVLVLQGLGFVPLACAGVGRSGVLRVAGWCFYLFNFGVGL
jgi:hypothetical protein